LEASLQPSSKQKTLLLLSGLLILSAIMALVVWVIRGFFFYLVSVPKEIAAPLITAAATIFVTTVTIMIGRYFERKKELDALYRDKKTEIYDQFLQKFFEIFFSEGTNSPDKVESDLVPFLREFTRKLVLWSGPEVITAFVKWKDHLAKGEPDAQSLFLTEDFLLAIRADLRHPSRGLQKGFFARLFLRNGNLFLAMASKNPGVTLQEVAIIEKFMADAPSTEEDLGTANRP
jgi:hypothetical protein